MLETTISDFIEQQFPQIYQEEGPFFIEFMKQYYVWLETDPTSPIYQARHHVSNHDIDRTVDNFLIFFKEKYLKNIQINTATNTKQLIKNSIDLYRSKGTENAIKLFFDLIFSAESEVYYPGTDVFRLSNAEWVIPYYLEVTSMPINRLMVGRAVVGVNSGATAFVEKLVRRKIKNNYVEVIYISAVSGAFQTGEIVKIANSDNTPFEAYPTVLGSLTTLEVVDGGTGFAKGEVVKLESRGGDQGRALVSELQSITGIVDFTLVDGGWGYSVNTDIYVSDKVLFLSNVHITSSTNTSLDNQIINIVQPMANVQWYDNTASFGVGNTVYNYYANGTLIGVNTIISAEYGTSNTTNFFLLNTTSGNNYMDPLAATYYTAGNTANFKVQNAGWSSNTAQAIAVGDISSNVTIYCSGNSQLFSVGDSAYQISNTNSVYARSRVKSVTTLTPNTFSMEVDSLEGLFLTNQSLLSVTSSGNVDIVSLSYSMGVRDITGSFNTSLGNYVEDTANTSLWNATLDRTSFGDGASTGFDSDLLYPESISLNTNYVRDHLDETLNTNWVNAVSYGTSLNSANLTNMTLDSALAFETKTLGMIAKLQNENPGIGYSSSPFVEVVDPLVAPYAKMDFVIRYSSTTGVFTIGEELTQVVNGAKGIVKFANTSEVHVKRLSFEDRWAVGSSSNAYLVIGTSSGFSAFPTEVTSDIEGIAGKNAVITTKVTSSNSAVLALTVTDSGFSFRHGDDVEFSSLDDTRSGNARAAVVTTGRGSGFYKTTSGFLSTNKYLYDGDYYQDFSYEIRSPITVGRYSDMLKSVLHVSGTRVFSAIMKNNLIDAKTTMISSSVVQANTPVVIVPPEWLTSGATIGINFMLGEAWVNNTLITDFSTIFSGEYSSSRLSASGYNQEDGEGGLLVAGELYEALAELNWAARGEFDLATVTYAPQVMVAYDPGTSNGFDAYLQPYDDGAYNFTVADYNFNEETAHPSVGLGMHAIAISNNPDGWASSIDGSTAIVNTPTSSGFTADYIGIGCNVNGSGVVDDELQATLKKWEFFPPKTEAEIEVLSVSTDVPEEPSEPWTLTPGATFGINFLEGEALMGNTLVTDLSTILGGDFDASRLTENGYDMTIGVGPYSSGSGVMLASGDLLTALQGMNWAARIEWDMGDSFIPATMLSTADISYDGSTHYYNGSGAVFSSDWGGDFNNVGVVIQDARNVFATSNSPTGWYAAINGSAPVLSAPHTTATPSHISLAGEVDPDGGSLFNGVYGVIRRIEFFPPLTPSEVSGLTGTGPVSTMWRVTFNENNGGNDEMAISNLRWHSQYGGSDISTGATVVASSVYDGTTPASNVLDGNLATIWRAAVGEGTPSYITCTFPTAVNIKELQIQCPDGSTMSPTDLTVSYHNDTTFVDVFTDGAGTNWNANGPRYFDDGGAPALSTGAHTFENGVLPNGVRTENWTIVDMDDATGGTTKALRSPDIGDNGKTYTTIQVQGPGTLSVRYKVSAENGYDGARVYKNGTEVAFLTGNTGTWQTFTTTITGTQWIVFKFLKDVSDLEGTDDIAISKITLA